MHSCNCLLLQLLGGGEGERLCDGVTGVWPEGDSEPQRFVTNTETATALRDHRREENNAPRFASHNFASSGVKEAVSNRFEIIHNEKGASTHCPSVARLLGC